MILQNKVIIITGGGRGIGRGISAACAQEGAKLVITGRNVATLETAKEALEKEYGVEVLAVPADNADEESIKRVIQKTIETFGRIDGLINNAQSGVDGRKFEDFTMDEFKQHFVTGPFAAFLYMKYAFPYLKESGGSVINFASGTGMDGTLQYGSYAASKEAMRGMSRVAAREWGPAGIRVNVVCPIVMTDGMQKWAEMFPEKNEEVLRTIPLRKYGRAKEDVGSLCAFLCSDKAEYITAQTICIDGGAIMRP